MGHGGLYFLHFGYCHGLGLRCRSRCSHRPNQIRAQATAIYLLIINVVGLMLGPTSVGFLTDMMGDPAMLRYAMAAIPLVVGIPAILLIKWGLKHYRAAAEEAVAWAEKV